jgi:Beta-lactamase enzyme family
LAIGEATEVRRLRRRRRLARAGRAGAVALLGAAAAAIVILPGTERGDRPGPSAGAAIAPLVLPPVDASEPARSGRPRKLPTRRQLAVARAYAGDRLGTVSFAVVDSRGDPHEMEGDRTFVTASVVKAMLLAAELDRLEASAAPLDSATRRYLERMITYSDNAAADLIYGRVGDAGLEAVAAEAGLKDFRVAGYWANAQLTASDMARLMSRVEQVMAGPYSEFGLGVLERIVPEQRWGIPRALEGQGWKIRFKGGWRATDAGHLVHQVAHLRKDAREVALAILTDGDPTMTYGIETVQGVTTRLFTRSVGGVRSGSPRDRRRASG